MSDEKMSPKPIGVEGAPWPTMLRKDIVQANGNIMPSYELGVIEDIDNALMLHSSRPYPEMMGELYRGMPVRDMLPAFEAIVHHANPDQNNRVIFVASDPGFGKSYAAVLVGKARDKRGPIVTDAGGKNLEYLLFKTVFDAEQSSSLTQAIDKALGEKSLDPLSVNALRDGFGGHFSDKFGRMAVDWKGLADDNDIKPETIKHVLDTITSIERWDSRSLGISFKVEKGPLVLAHEQGRDLVIDEMDKCKEGSEAPLQLVWQVLNGEIGEHTVQLGSLGPFTFRRGNPGLVMLTGNLPKDGKASHLISESFDRRVPRFEIPNFGEGSWKDITAKLLTGLPVPLLHEITPGKWEAPDPDAPNEQKWTINDTEQFTKKLFELSTLGMNDEEKRKVKEWRMSQVSNWENVLDASQHLGAFYHKWAQLVDPDSELYKSGQFADILMEVEDPQRPTLKVTPSTMIRHVENALVGGPNKKEAVQSGGFSGSFNWNEPKQPRKKKDAVEEDIGTRMAHQIMDEIYRTTVQAGKKHLYAQLLEDAKQAGLVGDPPPIAQLLNVDPTKVKGSLAQAKNEQGAMAELLRHRFPGLELSANDEDLLPLRYVQSAMAQVEAAAEKEGKISPYTTALFVPNTDLDTVQERLFDRIAADSKDPNEKLEDTKKRLPPVKLANSLTMLTSLALHSVGTRNLDALWNSALTDGGFNKNEQTAMAQNQSPTGIAVTTVCCAKGTHGHEEYTAFHVLKNAKKGTALIVGDEAIPDDLYNRLKKNKITYVNQQYPEAKRQVQSALKDMIDPKQAEEVKAALLLRNEMVGGATPGKTKDLADVLAEKEAITSTNPTFITTLNPEEIKHTDRVKATSAKERLLGRMQGK